MLIRVWVTRSEALAKMGVVLDGNAVKSYKKPGTTLKAISNTVQL